jgi:hypothetical protein
MSQELTSAAGTERTSTHTAPGVTADDQAEIDFWTAALEEHSNRAMLNISRESLTRLLGIVGKLRTEQRTPQLDLGERETWLTVEQEVNRDLVGSLQILERFTGTAEEKRFHAKKVRGLFARLLASRSVISSASPLSEKDVYLLEHLRVVSHGLDSMWAIWIRRLLAIIARLSASAPSPEDKGSEEALRLAFLAGVEDAVGPERCGAEYDAPSREYARRAIARSCRHRVPGGDCRLCPNEPFCANCDGHRHFRNGECVSCHNVPVTEGRDPGGEA